MSPATHALFGAWSGFVAHKLSPELAHALSPTTCMVAGAIAGNIPDIDTIVGPLFFSKKVRRAEPWYDHRGIVHSLWFLPVWALIGAFSLSGSPAHATFMPLLVLFGVAAASHLLLDMMDGSVGIMALPGLMRGYFKFPFALVEDVDFPPMDGGGPENAATSAPVTTRSVIRRVLQELVFAFLPIHLLFHTVAYFTL